MSARALSAARRISHLCGALQLSKASRHVRLQHTVASNEGDVIVSLGGVSVRRSYARRPELVPRGYEERGGDSQETLMHLRWMLQKDLLKQDIYLVGPSGPERRRLAFRFCEIMNREVEYLALTRDTTEADIKQRREIMAGIVCGD